MYYFVKNHQCVKHSIVDTKSQEKIFPQWGAPSVYNIGQDRCTHMCPDFVFQGYTCQGTFVRIDTCQDGHLSGWTFGRVHTKLLGTADK